MCRSFNSTGGLTTHPNFPGFLKIFQNFLKNNLELWWKQRQLQNENDIFENENKIVTDSRESMERKLINTQQDLAIAKMTITEIEAEFEKKIKFFKVISKKFWKYVYKFDHKH